MTNNYLALDAKQLAVHIEALLRDFPELAEDEELRADTLEGETDLNAVLARLLASAQDSKFMAGAVADRIGELAARKARFENKQDAMRALIFRLMTAANLPKVTLPEGTLSIGKGRDSVLVTNEASLPDWAWRVSKAPDKTAIKERLDAGKKVPGAEMKPADDVLKVRVS